MASQLFAHLKAATRTGRAAVDRRRHIYRMAHPVAWGPSRRWAPGTDAHPPRQCTTGTAPPAETTAAWSG
eukprot:scaffold96856_cov63-Phaeocystis_antarctica.AAC.3